jgi:hypothetical protein
MIADAKANASVKREREGKNIIRDAKANAT